jgi:hypothetical protein
MFLFQFTAPRRKALKIHLHMKVKEGPHQSFQMLGFVNTSLLLTAQEAFFHPDYEEVIPNLWHVRRFH